ncbi:ATP-binding protein [Alkalinema pantanalense CENA528]|uniref:ATP-binding protein n=1 Tax=Alkalinema pantanalense TaxID=1620705 RepID=UPI003D6EF575
MVQRNSSGPVSVTAAPTWAELATIAQSSSHPPALVVLSRIFDLTEFEQDLLMLCVGCEMSAEIAQLCAKVQGNPQLTYPTLSLALAAFSEPHWSALTPVRPLRRWRLIEVAKGDSLTQSRLTVDERILHYLQGVSYFDDRLRGLVESCWQPADLPPSQQRLVENIVEVWSQPGMSPVIQLCGNGMEAQTAIATMACATLGVQLGYLRAADFPTIMAEREALVTLWEREALLSQSALLVDYDSATPDRLPQLQRFVEQLRGMVIVAGREPLVLNQRSTIRLDLPKLTSIEQHQIWQQVLGTKATHWRHSIDRLVAQFNLSSINIQTILNETQIKYKKNNLQTVGIPPSDLKSEELFNTLWDTCRVQARTRLDDLAQRIPTIAGWDDLVLPELQRQTLREIVAQVRQRTQVYETWGFAVRGANGLGISALFAGTSGTGKTMAAEVLAYELRLDLYRIDLSQVVSKYIGETEKNLRRVFEAAETGGAILLFDEADALFGKRSEVKDSHDRYANIEVSYLLQRMEAYRGLAILTTNLRSAIDTAFLRRIRFVVQFPFPDWAQRREIWQRIFPAKLPTEQLNFDKLAQLNIAGGNIRNIALNAAFLAADAGDSVCMEHLLQATRSEYIKLEKTLTETEIGGWI